MVRRDAGRARGKPIEDAILVAALNDLADHGLEGLSIPRIARASEVNKTTIYRRWATREALVEAALAFALTTTGAPQADTGSLRGDLTAVVAGIAERLATAPGQALARVAMSDKGRPHFMALSGAALSSELDAGIAMIRRAAERGEWDLVRHPPDVVMAMISGSVLHRVLLEGRAPDEGFVTTIVDVVLQGLQGR